MILKVHQFFPSDSQLNMTNQGNISSEAAAVQPKKVCYGFSSSQGIQRPDPSGPTITVHESNAIGWWPGLLPRALYCIVFNNDHEYCGCVSPPPYHYESHRSDKDPTLKWWLWQLFCFWVGCRWHRWPSLSYIKHVTEALGTMQLHLPLIMCHNYGVLCMISPSPLLGRVLVVPTSNMFLFSVALGPATPFSSSQRKVWATAAGPDRDNGSVTSECPDVPHSASVPTHTLFPHPLLISVNLSQTERVWAHL